MLILTSLSFTFIATNGFASDGYDKEPSKKERMKMKKRMHKGHMKEKMKDMSEDQRAEFKSKMKEIKESGMNREEMKAAKKELMESYQ